ncbi:hypothetical protein L7F22_056171 [Adiantum nelumboides]|nr:hypothetical protein [Adiantum nelumboides]
MAEQVIVEAGAGRPAMGRLLLNLCTHRKWRVLCAAGNKGSRLRTEQGKAVQGKAVRSWHSQAAMALRHRGLLSRWGALVSRQRTDLVQQARHTSGGWRRTGDLNCNSAGSDSTGSEFAGHLEMGELVHARGGLSS